jgi:predicted PurR-regulated permease PerM
MESESISARKFRVAFVVLLVAAVSALFLVVIWPFLKPLLLGAIFSGLSSPLYQWITRKLGGRASLGAVVTLLILFILVAGPLSIFAGIVGQQAINVSNHAIPWVTQHFGSASTFNAHDWLVSRFPSLAEHVPSQEKLLENFAAAAQAAGGFLVGFASRMTAGTAGFLLDLFIMIYAMFFFLKDGEKILERIFYYMPLSHEDEAIMLQRFASITRATVKGTLVIGLVQGTFGGIAFWAAGIEGAAFWGTAMTLLSIVPGIGSAIVWLPAVVFLFITGQPLSATLLLIWCSAVVGTIDNILRPILVGKDAQMPDLFILIGTLGGLFFFGPLGFIVGPLVCGLFLTVWDIYGATFKSILPPVKSLRTAHDRPNER